MPWYGYLWIAIVSFAGTLVALAVVIWFIGRVQDELGEHTGSGEKSP